MVVQNLCLDLQNVNTVCNVRNSGKTVGQCTALLEKEFIRLSLHNYVHRLLDLFNDNYTFAVTCHINLLDI